MSLRHLVGHGFASLSRFALHHPKRVLLAALVITLAAAPGILGLKLRTDGRALLSPNAPEVLYDKQIRERFGIEDQIVVLVQSWHPDGIFNPVTLQLVRDLTSAFAKIPGVHAENLLSLATEPSFRLRPGTLTQQKLLEPPLQTRPELDQLRNDLRRIQLYTGTLVSFDGISTAILVGVPSGADRPALYQEVLRVIDQTQSALAGIKQTNRPLTVEKGATEPRPDEVSVTGAPVAESLLGLHILEDLGVPKSLLGISTRGGAHAPRPSGFYGFRLWIARHVGLVPMAALVMMAVLLVTFRNVLAALVPLPGVAATMIVIFGLMGWFHVPIYLTIAVMPVLLTAISVTNDIYLFNRYFTLLREKPGVSHVILLEETFDQLACPVASTSLTAVVGFLSFGLSPLGPVQAFGVWTGLGALFGLFYSLTVVPAMLALLEPARLVPARTRGGRKAVGNLAHAFERLGAGIVRARWWVVALALFTLALTPFGLRHLAVQDSWTDAFDPDSEFRRATEHVNSYFHGMHLLLVTVSAPKQLTGELPPSALNHLSLELPGKVVEDPAAIAGSAATLTLRLLPGATSSAASNLVWQTHIEMANRTGDHILARLAQRPAPAGFWEQVPNADRVQYSVGVRSHVQPGLIRTEGDLAGCIRMRRDLAVGEVLGPAEYLTTTRFMVRPNDPDARRLPQDAIETKLMWDYYGLARGRQRLRQVVDSNFWESVTTVFLKDANFVATAELMRWIKDLAERLHLTQPGFSVGFAGDVALSQSLIHGIVTTQLRSLVWSLVGIFLVTAALGGSLRWGVYCLLPSLLAVLIKFAFMGWFGIPLGVATSMFAAMTLGIGVNCAIHLLESFHHARSHGAEVPDALRQAMRFTGPSALINTVSVSLGFGVLILSQVPANARLGILLVLGLVNCLVASLLLLPVLLHFWPTRVEALKR